MLLNYKNLFHNKLLSKVMTSVSDGCVCRLMATKGTVKTSLDQNYLSVDDIGTAKMVANHLSDDLKNDKSVIFESSPGTCILTKHLLKSGAQLVRVFEDNPLFLDKLKKLKIKYPKNLQIIDKQIINLPNLVRRYVPNYEYDITDWFSGVPTREWTSEPVIKFVAVFSPNNSTHFMRFVIRLLLRKDLFFSLGRTQFLVFVSEKEYKYMNATPEHRYRTYRSTSVLYNTLFDIESLETIPYEKFALSTKSTNLSKRLIKGMEGNARLVRLTPKLYLDAIDGQTLKDYYYFVTQTFMKRKNWIIPFLENWFPNCGPDLIRKGIPVFKYFGDLKPEEVWHLFQYFRNRADYHNSIYRTLSMSYTFDDDIDTQEIKDEEMDSKDKSEAIEDEL